MYMPSVHADATDWMTSENTTQLTHVKT